MDGEKKELIDDRRLLGSDDGYTKWQKRLMYSEPSAFLIGLASCAFTQFNQEYLYYRVGEDYDFPSWFDLITSNNSDTECVDSDNGSLVYDAKAGVSSEAAYLSTKISLFSDIPPIFLSLFILSYTDTAGRRLGLILPALGGLVNMVVYLAVEYTQASLNYLYLGNLIEGLSGGYLVLFSCGFVYVYDTCNEKDLTMRFAIYQSIFFLSSAIASIMVGILIDAYGFISAFWFTFACYLAIILHVWLLLPESLPHSLRKPFNPKEALVRTLSGLGAIVKTREPISKTYSLLSLLAIAFVTSIISTGNINLQTVYAEGVPFCLNSVQIGMLLALLCSLSVVTAVVEIKVFGMCLSEELLLVYGALSQVFASTFEGLCTSAGTLYIAICLISLGTLIVPIVRCLISKTVDKHEQGRSRTPLRCMARMGLWAVERHFERRAAQAFVGSLNCIGELIGDTAFVAIYAATVNVFYGAVHFVIAGMMLVSGVLAGIVWYRRWLDKTQAEEKAEENRGEKKVYRMDGLKIM